MQVAISQCKLYDAYDGRGGAAFQERRQRRRGQRAANDPGAAPANSGSSGSSSDEDGEDVVVLADLAESAALVALALPSSFGRPGKLTDVTKNQARTRTPRRYTSLLMSADAVPAQYSAAQHTHESDDAVHAAWLLYWQSCEPNVGAEFQALGPFATDDEAKIAWEQHVAARYADCWAYFLSWDRPQEPQEPQKPQSPVLAELPAKPAISRKYWQQRFRYFSRFDEGIMMDDEGWYSVTPEIIAEHLARRCQGDVVIDGFCGVGGNTIQLAMTCHRVVAIDIDPHKIACARHNARLYGVDNRIEFIIGDFFKVVARLQFGSVDAVFLSPPWGGPDYINTPVYDLSYVTPDARRMFAAARSVTPNVAMLLPRNVNIQQLAALAVPLEIEEQFINGKFKTLTAYWGNLIDVPELSV